MNLTDLFPKLTRENHEITSPATVRYNCIAWAARNTERWWQPGVFWPVDSSRDDHGIGNVVEAFRSLGYEECDDGTLEAGFEKLALYGSAMMYTHAARAAAGRKVDEQAWAIAGHYSLDDRSHRRR